MTLTHPQKLPQPICASGLKNEREMVCRGSPTGGRWSHWDKFFKSSKEYGTFSQDSNAVSVVVIETNDFYKLIEAKPRPVRLTWWLDADNRIEGQLIKSMADSTFTDRQDEFEAGQCKITRMNLST